MLVVLFTSWELCRLKLPATKTEPVHPLAFLSFTCLPQAGRQTEFLSPLFLELNFPFLFWYQKKKKKIFFFILSEQKGRKKKV